ncbi:uncharacterized protein AruCF_4962 [Achromobacter ruhlandii]|nr:uncharacterized protein AruCF_4962 [Achromobacter ruhlandii]
MVGRHALALGRALARSRSGHASRQQRPRQHGRRRGESSPSRHARSIRIPPVGALPACAAPALVSRARLYRKPREDGRYRGFKDERR